MPANQIERKFIDLKELKVSKEGSGAISGYRSVFGEIDEGGDLIVKGFFADSIPEFLSSGFSAHSHDWSFKEAIGFPVKAEEDDHGFMVESQFHGTKDAQDIRQKAIERFEAGKTVGFSFGYSVSDKDYIEAKDFKEQLPNFVKPERLQANLLKAQKFDRIRILKKGEVIEDSIVTSPMNKLAMATGVKSIDAKSMLAEEMAATTPSFWEVQSAACRVIRKIAESAKNANITDLAFDWKAKVNLVCSEFGSETAALAIAQVQDYLDSTDDEFYLKGITESESFESFDGVVSTIEKFTQKMQSHHDIRTKDGRVLSASNRTKVQAAVDALVALLDASEPKPKEKGLDVNALRTQSARLESLAIAALAG